MKITFVLPGPPDVPIGGFQVVYEYANRLAERNHHLTILHGPSQSEPPPAEAIRISSPDWFPLREEVESWLLPELTPSRIPVGDAVIATAWTTAGTVAACTDKAGEKYYLIQHYETWLGTPEEVDATWRLPLHKIVIARWLWDIGEHFGEASHMSYIPIGIDLDLFRCKVSPKEKAGQTVALLNHARSWKGTEDGLAALSEVRARCPGLRVELFGTPDQPTNLPEWVAYYSRPFRETIVDLYNRNAVFLHPSWHEGWGLPPLEAMACGSAVVSTEHGGTREFLGPDVARMVAPRDIQAMTEALIEVLKDDKLRVSLATRGIIRAQDFGWAPSVDKMEALLTGQVTAEPDGVGRGRTRGDPPE